MLLNARQFKRLYSVLSKLSNLYNDFYIFRHGRVLSLDIEKPYLVNLDSEYLTMLYDITGEFKIIHMTNLKDFKRCIKSLEEGKAPITPIDSCYYVVSKEEEEKQITSYLEMMVNTVASCETWSSFRLADDPDENAVLLESLFKSNNYHNFSPVDNPENPPIILTKSILPLVTEKNFGKLYYSTSKIQKGLFRIIFDFQYELFRLNSIHYYIPIEEEQDDQTV